MSWWLTNQSKDGGRAVVGKERFVLIMVLKIIIILGLLAVMFIIGLLALLGDAGWLIIVGIALLTAGGVAYKVRFHTKLRVSTYICILLLVVNVSVGLTLYVGTVPRPLSRQERSDILAYLELQYPSQRFRIVSGNARHSTGGWGSGLDFLSFGAFSWNEVEAIAADSNDVQFEVTGVSQSSWRILVGSFYFSDHYSLIQPQITLQDIHDMEDEIWEIILAHRHLFDDCRFERRTSTISFIPKHIEAYVTITYTHMLKSDFDESAENEKLQIVRDEIAAITGFESVALNARFYFSDE